MTKLRTVQLLTAVATLGVMLSGCAALPSPDVPPDIEPTPQTSEVPAVALTLTTRGAYPVIDDGTGAQICTAELQMMPPGCGGGTSLPGWDWSALVGQYQERAGVRWGYFIVTGTWDAETMTLAPTEVESAPLTGSTDEDLDHGYSTPCEAPPGGWVNPDTAMTTAQAYDTAALAASKTDGFAAYWRDEVIGRPVVILNVSTTGDVDAMTAVVRTHWDGPLCVTAAARREAEIIALREALLELPSPPLLGVGTGGTEALYIYVSVAYDDGSLQDELDAEYGPGAVRVSSFLVPVDE